jgi:hypothetical protein
MTFALKRILAVLALAGTAIGAGAETISKDTYRLAKDDIKAIYTKDQQACNALSGNAKDLCVKQAKAQESVAMANLEFQHTGSEKDRKDYLEARYESKYEVAKEMCDDQAGNNKDVCVAQAKAARDKSKADMKADLAIVGALDDAQEARLKADYGVAKERCDSLAGDAKNVCVASAKARFYQ